MKVLKTILNTLVWTLLGLYLVFILTFSIPAVQEYAGQRVAGMLASKLGTSVSIGRLDYNIPSSITLRDVDIRDQKGNDMLHAGRISARLDLLPLAEGKVSIATAQVFGAFARLYQATADSKPNFQFVLDSLASKDTTSTTPLDLRINSLILRNSRVSYDLLYEPQTPGQLNPSHLDMSSISGHIVLKALTDDSLNVNVKRLSLKEKSGLAIERLGFKLEASRNALLLSGMTLNMPGTRIALGDIKANYRFRGDHFVSPSLTYSGSIKPTTITLADLSCLLPSLKTFQGTLSLATNFQGDYQALHIPSLTIGSTTGDISLNASVQIGQLNHQHPTWHADIADLSLSAKTVGFITENLKGRRAEIPQELIRLGNIHLSGNTWGTGLREVATRNQLNTDAGSASLTFSMDEQRQFSGTIDTKDFDLKRLLDNSHFGQLSTNIRLSGQLPSDKPLSIKADGIVSQFTYNGYDYQNIRINGFYSPADIHGLLAVDDNNIGLNIEGSVVKSHSQSKVNVTARIEHLSPQAINLSNQWGDASFSATVNADFTASSIRDAKGSLALNNMTMQSTSDHYQLSQLLIQSGYDGDTHYITLNSDFGEASVTGDFDYQTLPQSITNFIASRLPTMPGLPKVNPHTRNNFTLHANIHKTDWLQKLLFVPLTLDAPLTLSGIVNDNTRQIALNLEAPQLSYDDSRYANGRVIIQSPNDSLSYDISLTKLLDTNDKFDIQVAGHVYDNRIMASLLWDNRNEPHTSGKLSLSASFDASLDGHRVTHVNMEPSTVLMQGAEWAIHPCHITYYDKHLDVKNFNLRHDDQFLTIDGKATTSPADSLLVSMHDIDIEYILDLIGFDAVDFNGYATGGGSIRGVFGSLEADAKLKVRDFLFEHGRMGTLDANVVWNREDEQIDIRAIADDGPDATTYINGYVSPARNFIDLGIVAEGTSLQFAHSFTESFIGSIEGSANGAVRLAGPLDAINLTGDLVLNGKALVSTLNCFYELRNDSLHIVPNEIEFTYCPVYDKYGHKGMLTGGIHHQNLTNLTFDINVDADNLLAYDFRDFGDATFYGTVLATGHVGIHGRENRIDINADVTPQQGTVFVYNAASPDAVNDQEFIQWGTAKNKHAEDSEYSEHSEHSENSENSENSEQRDDIYMRLKINATPHASIRLLMDDRTNDYITLKGNGELQTEFYNKGSFNMFGTYRVTEGTYGLTIQNIIRKNFVFREGGTVVFSGDPYDASLNLQAQNTVSGVSLSDLNVGRSFSNTVRVNCLMNITGQPRQPHVDFDLEMPNVNADEQQMVRSIINSEEEMNQQVIYLLAVGRFYPQGANNATDGTNTGQSKTSLAMQSLLSGTLSGQINNILGQVIKSNNWNFGANISTGDEGWNNAEYEGIISGRLLNNRLLINGQFGYRDNATTSTQSFIGDFDIRYLLFPNGNLALKVYNQTNDRYFTKSSLNTQGIGIIMKKDFNGLGDLFGTRKKKKPTQQNTSTTKQ